MRIVEGCGEIEERFIARKARDGAEVLRYVTRRAEDERKKKPGHSGRNDGLVVAEIAERKGNPGTAPSRLWVNRNGCPTD
jgi:hypothetical protein